MIMSGAPLVTKYHAVRVAEMALSMKRDIVTLTDPSTGNPLQIRIGKFGTHFIFGTHLLQTHALNM